MEAQSAVLRCMPARAAELLQTLSHVAKTETTALEVRIMLARLNGGPTHAETLLTLLHPELGWLDAPPVPAVPAESDALYDDRYYQRVALPTSVGPLLPTSTGGLRAWLVDPSHAADVGAPGSALAACR